MEEVTQWLPVGLCVLVVLLVWRRRKQSMAARSNAESEARAGGGAAGARADVGGINLHLHFGGNAGEIGGANDYVLPSGYDDDEYEQHFVVPVSGEWRSELPSGQRDIPVADRARGRDGARPGGPRLVGRDEGY